ncbi:Putative alpha-mannosidase, partial [Candidatus Arthromitus sp. SFB-4]
EVIKKAEDSDYLIVRLYEFHNKRTSVSIEFIKNIQLAYECDLLENNLEIITPNANKFDFEIKPFEIKTFKIKL